ncbi:CBS domain containing protein [Pseudonocardia sp. N23]|nr:CBS domain containing protein [Pseudonocardia sp. N23]
MVTVRADTPLVPAAALLAAHGFTAAPVLGRRGTLIGIVTESDLIRGRVAPPARSGADTPALVEEVMTTPVETVRRDDPVAQVAALMLRSCVRSLPVVDEGELVGVVTRRDLLRAVARHEETSAQVRRRRGVRS